MGADATTDGNLCVENATIAELQQALAEGRTSASALAHAYLARIEAYDRAGPHLNAVREINPEALATAASLDRVKPSPRQPLAGIDPRQGQRRDWRPPAPPAHRSPRRARRTRRWSRGAPPAR
jgi:hypothetical protein